VIRQCVKPSTSSTQLKFALEKKNKKGLKKVIFTCFLLSAVWAFLPEDFLVSPVQAPKAKQIKTHNVYNETYIWKNLDLFACSVTRDLTQNDLKTNLTGPNAIIQSDTESTNVWLDCWHDIDIFMWCTS